MEQEKKIKHFARDRCKKGRIKQLKKQVIIEYLAVFLLAVSSVAAFILCPKTIFASKTEDVDRCGYFPKKGGYCYVALTHPDGWNYISLRINFNGPTGIGTDRWDFAQTPRDVDISLGEVNGGDANGVTGFYGQLLTNKYKTYINSDEGYTIVQFKVKWTIPAHYTWYPNNNPSFDVQALGGRFNTWDSGITHHTESFSFTSTYEINLCKTGLLSPQGEKKRVYGCVAKTKVYQPNYTFTYKTNGGTITNLNESQNVDGNAVYTRACGGGLGRMPTVTKNGYYLDGWYYDNGTKLSLPITLCSGNQSVTAKWVAYKHNVTYDLQGGKYDDDKRTELNGCKIIPNGVYHMKSGCGTNMYMHVKDCYTEKRADPVVIWDSTGDKQQADWIFERYGSTQYYYIISKMNGLALALDGTPSSDQSNKELELWSQEDGVADYLWFIKENSDGTVAIYNKSTNKCLDVYNADTTNGTKVGQWTANNSNAQKWKLESVSQKDYPDRKQFGDHNLVINSVEPVYTNHTFIGWNTSRDGTGKFYYPGDTYSAINTGTNVTLYAVWQNDDYIITYDSNGGTGTMAAQSAKGETAVKLTKNVFQRAGYLFTGWATDRYAMKPSYLDEAQYPNMEPEVTLYAQWQKTGTGFIQRPFLDDKMFYKAISILGQNGTTYDREKIDSSMAHIDTADNPGYFSKK